MNESNHREVLAAYLSGVRPVGRAELERALGAVRADPAYRRGLERLLGPAVDEVSDCERLAARLAELAELSPRELARRFPSFAAHLEACRDCRQAYWEFRPYWTTVAAASLGRVASGGRQRLAEGLRLLVTGARAVVELGLAPPAIPFLPVAATAAGPSPSPPAGLAPVDPGWAEAGPPAVAGPIRMEWRLRDESTGGTVWLACQPRLDGREGVRLEAGLDGFPAAPAGPARYRLLRQPQGALLLSGTLAALAAAPAELSPGAYLLVLELPLPVPRSWEIPVEVVGPAEGEP